MHTSPPDIIGYFSVIPDPRRKNHNKTRHLLTDIIVVAVLAVISGADTWEEIETFGEERRRWLKQFCSLKHGIPSVDTFARVFSLLDHEAFGECFMKWVRTIHTLTNGSVVAIDGKSIRRSHGKGLVPLHLVHAFASENGIVLGQKKVDGKSNEITAIPELLKTLSLKGCIVTIDAMGTQKLIAQKIKEQSADYILAAKANHGRLHRDIITVFTTHDRSTFEYTKTTEQSHGRGEIRECWVTSDLSMLRDTQRWSGLKSIVAITDTRTLNGKTTTANRYFITSLAPDAQKILSATRAHWKVENSLHWSLDVAFREDLSRIRMGHAQENFALLRKFALNLLKKETTVKNGLRVKRFRAGISENYLLKVLGVSS